MMPVINVYDEGGGMVDPTRHDGEEFVHVIEGCVELTVGSAEPFVLEAGDSAYYRSDVPHSFRNAGTGVARFFGVTTPPNL
jgi:quercetin dioxygenase-like cupin family protein